LGVEQLAHATRDATQELHERLRPPDGSAEVAPMMEYPATESPMRNALVTGSPRMQDGEAVIGDEPGLGIAVDADTIQRYGV
jgi:L-alanine-DL-glutamate epimerase-like enolase superfamily enzyme